MLTVHMKTVLRNGEKTKWSCIKLVLLISLVIRIHQHFRYSSHSFEPYFLKSAHSVLMNLSAQELGRPQNHWTEFLIYDLTFQVICSQNKHPQSWHGYSGSQSKYRISNIEIVCIINRIVYQTLPSGHTHVIYIPSYPTFITLV